MCIICYKPAGEKKIPRRIFKKCWDNNDDGAGFAYWDNDKKIWHVEKGFENFSSFWRCYRKHQFGTDDTVIAHFRIGTSGKGNGDDPGQTHPFPVTDDLDAMEVTKFSSENIIFHNGIIGAGDFNYSDTMYAIKEIVHPLHPYMSDENIFRYMEDPLDVKHNRWIITGQSTVYQYGTWITEDGIDYSNDTFKNNRWTETTSYVDDDSWWNQQSYGSTAFGAGQMYRKADGSFDWEKWDKRHNTKPDPADKIAPGSDNQTQIVGVIKDDDGDLIPDNSYRAEVAQDLECCPNCYHDKYLDHSPFNVGDSICLVCGAVYTALSGDIHMFDPDVQAKYMDRLREEEGLA